jgi:hypothetical protein
MDKVAWYWDEQVKEYTADMGLWFRMHVKPLGDDFYHIDLTIVGDDEKPRLSMLRGRDFRADTPEAAQQACMVAALKAMNMLSRQLIESLS